MQALDLIQYYIAHFTHLTPLYYICKIPEKISEAPLDQIMDLLVSNG